MSDYYEDINYHLQNAIEQVDRIPKLETEIIDLKNNMELVKLAANSVGERNTKLEEYVGLLKKFISESPCDPDITEEQTKAYLELKKFEENNKFSEEK